MSVAGKNLEKLTRVALAKHWAAPLYVRLAVQLYDSFAQELAPEEAVCAVLAAVEGRRTVDLSVLEYLSALAGEPRSPIGVGDIVAYLTKHESPLNAMIVIHLAKKPHVWSVDPLSEYIRALCGSQRVYEVKAVAFLAMRIAGSVDVDSVPFKSALKTLVAAVRDKIDATMAAQLQDAYTAVLSDSREVAVTDKVRINRVYRLLWLERVMDSSDRIQSEPFKVELQQFLRRSNAAQVIQDLIATAFDCYAAALLRKSQTKYLALWKSFIVKRLPVVIKGLVSTATVDSLVCQPIQQLDRGTLNLLRISGGGDALDEMFSSFPSTTSDIRHDFLLACANLNIISRESIQRTLDQEASSISDSSAALGEAGSSDIILNGNTTSIDDLFYSLSQENPEYLSAEESLLYALVSSYEDLDGMRQETIAHKIVTMVNEWIDSQNSRSLRRFCQLFASRAGVLDALFLHICPVSLLAPLTQLIEAWKQDEDEMSFQDVYADVGSILLFIILAYTRYDLSAEDLGSHSAEMSRLITQCGQGVALDELSSDQQDTLGGWIQALFDSGGISDELMKSCSIKDLMVLTPLIFQQAIFARARNVIDSEVFKGGLDYYLQPFLAPTLVSALRFISKALWAGRDVAVTLQVLKTIVTAFGELSGESSTLLQIILTIVGDELYQVVKERKQPNDPVADEVLNALLPYVKNPEELFTSPGTANPASSSSSDGSVPNPAVTAAAAAAAAAGVVIGGNNSGVGIFFDDLKSLVSFVGAIKDEVVMLSSWMQSVDQGSVSGPPFYSYKLLPEALALLGARQVLSVLLDELDLAETAQGMLPYTLDVVTAIVITMDTVPRAVTSMPSSKKQPLGGSVLHELLSLSEKDVYALRQKDPSVPESIVLSNYRKLLQKVQSMMDYCLVEETADKRRSLSSASKANHVDTSDKKDSSNQPTNKTNDNENNSNTNNENNDNGFAGMDFTEDQLMGLDVGLSDDRGLFDSDMLMDMS
ncbi:hypothetical protein TRVA0_084S00254 [Trichomonascus vanleenenianus]|uniref:Nut1p n=1 Tax=Trichomonascus vanleenenianus TaxID=2268995 RepID=UPI003ECA28FA